MKPKCNKYGVLRNWKRAKGIKHRVNETNSGLAERDYTVQCETGGEPIIIFEGYWIWWCRVHHQPFAKCNYEIAEERLRRIALGLIM